nr:MAG TPA: hypothetical protein [Caudoviricetes sp.]
MQAIIHIYLNLIYIRMSTENYISSGLHLGSLVVKLNPMSHIKFILK